jgi:cellulose biosynthesis protein BcsQ
MLTDVQGGYLHERYDTLIIDPPTTADVKLYNAIHATRSLIVPTSHPISFSHFR